MLTTETQHCNLILWGSTTRGGVRGAHDLVAGVCRRGRNLRCFTVRKDTSGMENDHIGWGCSCDFGVAGKTRGSVCHAVLQHRHFPEQQAVVAVFSFVGIFAQRASILGGCTNIICVCSLRYPHAPSTRVPPPDGAVVATAVCAIAGTIIATSSGGSGAAVAERVVSVFQQLYFICGS